MYNVFEVVSFVIILYCSILLMGDLIVFTVSYRPVLLSERAPYRKNNKAIVTKEMIRIKSGHWPQRGARYQEELVG
jgi:hypothetical protein